MTDRGALGLGYTVITPANHYPSRLPALGNQPVVKLVTPRMAPSRIGQYLVTLDAGGGTTRRVGAGYERFFFVFECAVTLVTAGSGRDVLTGGGYAYLPSDTAYELRAGDDGPARLLIVKRRY